jgi:O-antigen/teichoic acid export membrane protein
MRNHVAKGTIFITTANVALVLLGCVTHMVLARTLTVLEYGQFGVIMSLIGFAQVPLMAAVPKSLSRFIADGNWDLGVLYRRALHLQAALAAVMAVAMTGAARPLAHVLSDPALTSHLRFATMTLIAYALYSCIMGMLNGHRLFLTQALIILLVGILRLGAVSTLVGCGYGLRGGILGYVIAFAIPGAFVFIPLRRKMSGEFITHGRFMRFSIPLLLFSVCGLLLISMDLYFVKALLEPSKAGIYASASMISRLPNFVFIGFSATLLPSLSRATGKGDREQQRGYVTHAYRSLLLFIIPLTMILSLNAGTVLRVIYTADYLPASASLSVLVIGIAFYGLYHIPSMMLVGLGGATVVATVALLLMVPAALLNHFLITTNGIMGAALATTGIMLLGAVTMSVILSLRLGGIMRGTTARNLAVACAAMVVSVYGLRSLGANDLLNSTVSFAIFVFMLVIFRELSGDDYRLLKAMIRLGGSHDGTKSG